MNIRTKYIPDWTEQEDIIVNIEDSCLCCGEPLPTGMKLCPDCAYDRSRE